MINHKNTGLPFFCASLCWGRFPDNGFKDILVVSRIRLFPMLLTRSPPPPLPPTGEIPDAAFIHAARKRRQLARELGGEPPLVETDAPKKRLTREDEEEQDGSDDEDDKMVNFSGVKNKSQRQKIAEEIGRPCLALELTGDIGRVLWRSRKILGGC